MRIMRLSGDCQRLRSTYSPAVSSHYSWSSSRDRDSYHLPGPDRLGWWAALAMLLSVLLHLVLFFALDRLKIAFKFDEARELSTRPVDIRQVEIPPLDMEREQPVTPEKTVEPPRDVASLLDDVELLDALPKNQEIDIKPDVSIPEYALKMENPAKTGTPEASVLEISSNFEIDSTLPEFGSEPVSIKPAEIGQLTVDPGHVQADDSALGKFTDELIQKGANGVAKNGTLDGITSLDSLLDLPANTLISKKTMLPSDLLFEFNKSELRESAKVGLMKLGLLMDRNSELYCWIEGHTDLVGGDEFNLNLSIKRAEAVKNYLVKSLRMDADKIITRGFGRFSPIISFGSAMEQAGNRRVEIRMRKTPPTEEQRTFTPQKATVIEEPPPPPTPRAVLVKPKRIPIEEDEISPPRAAPVIEKAKVIEEPPEPPRAAPVEEFE